MTKQFKANDGTYVDQERWGWVVDYKDGTQLHQFDTETNNYNNFASIDQDKVSKITMVNFEKGDSRSVALPSGAKVVHYYDNLIQAPMGGELVHHRSYVYGYELDGKQEVFTILPDDTLVTGVA